VGQHAQIGAALVAAAKPRFKDFRVDFEKISTAASRAAREGRNGLSPDDAAPLFHDLDWDLRRPLQERYMREGAFEPVAHFHAKRFKLLFGRNEHWPDEPARHALRLFADSGVPEIGVRLIRTYADMQHARVKSDYATRKPRKSRVSRSEGVERTIAAVGAAIAAAIPDRKAELLTVLEAMEPYLAAHGTADDRSWLEQVRRELWMEKRA
jgi:hypothetical protein